MSLLDKITGLFDKDRKQLLTISMAPDHVDDKQASLAIEAGKTYFRLRLSQMFLTKEVQTLRSWYPAVHSLVKFQFADQPALELPNIAEPTIQGSAPKDNKNIIAKEMALTPAIPFSGGTVLVSAGLFAVEGENYLNNFIGVLGSFGNLLVVPQLSAAIKIAQPLANGIQELFGAGKGHLHVGLKQEYAGGELKSGYIVVFKATESQIDKGKLWVVNDELRQGSSLTNNQPFEGFDYMLLRMEVFTERDDWDKLTFIDEPFQQALDALLQQDDENAEARAKVHLQTALRRAYKSPDLTQADRTRVVARLKERFAAARSDMNLQGATGKDVDLQAVMRRSMSVDAALEQGEPTEDDLLLDEKT